MKRRVAAGLVLAAAIGPRTAVAATADVLLQGGVSQVYGALAQDRKAPSWGLLVRSGSPVVDTAIGAMSTYWEVGIQGLHSAGVRNPAFPFHASAPLDFSNAELSVNACFLASSFVHPCFGVGNVEMTVDGEYNEQNYGAPLTKLELQHADAAGLIESFTAQYALVPQIVEARRSSFSLVSYLIGVGWRFSSQ